MSIRNSTLTIVYTLQAFPSTPVKPTHMGSWRWIPSVFRRWSFMSEQMASTLLKSSYLTRKVNCIWRGLLKLTITFVLAMRDSLLMICSDNTCKPKHQSVSVVLPLIYGAACVASRQAHVRNACKVNRYCMLQIAFGGRQSFAICKHSLTHSLTHPPSD